jgi:hypothetical protein
MAVGWVRKGYVCMCVTIKVTFTTIDNVFEVEEDCFWG